MKNLWAGDCCIKFKGICPAQSTIGNIFFILLLQTSVFTKYCQLFSSCVSNYFSRTRICRGHNGPLKPVSSHLSSGLHTRTSTSASVQGAIDQIMIPHSRAEVNMENQKLHIQQGLLENEVTQLNAQLAAANSHCTVMQRAVTEARTELENQRKKKWKSVKTKSRFVTHLQMKALFEAEKAEHLAKEKEEAEKAAQKDADEAARVARIRDETTTKVFNGSLTSYKRKDDLVIISGALELPTEGKVGDLFTRIKAHLDSNPQLAESARFAGLYGRRRTTTNL